MPSIRCYVFSALAAVVSLASAGEVCDAFGIDYVDGGSYFINTNSQDNFTFVTEFEGCNDDIANTMIVPPDDAPDNDEIICSDLDTTDVDDTPEMATCPIKKSQMVSGPWIILVMGNNGDGDPFAYERDITLDCGPQVTATVTPTVTYNITVTPTSTSTVWSTVTNTTTFGPTTTYTLPSSTANYTKTITPAPVYTTQTWTVTRHKLTWTRTQTIKTTTQTASCTVPPKPQWPDKTCTYSPTKLHPKALETGKPNKKGGRYWRGAARAVNIEEARRRFDAAQKKRDLKERAAVQVEERAPDAPTIYVTYSVAVNVTSTLTAAPTTTTETDLTTTVTSTTLPPATVFSGIYTSTTTLPTKTKTKKTIAYTTLYTTKTIHATWTLTTTVTPTAVVSSCKTRGGHWGPGRW
ncbi:uncharacterized protein BDZ99DRAFT_55601 [Mytilinidion resinicola]|uniref:Uncharacterized protein n=1 Tax=Mytilinidion resinicola TaxID=574789 RepID=A0A6A6YI27_9PEZI|nr:uncharacterized protein BDZ99DRAFT_55601 [Mytilinidion resinicola]KAF2808430.1 hypothetical protein BDZ99DRAFT_55601 [Mytilinidion resinicola]